MAEGAQRLASLVVVGGSLKDRRYDLDEVVAEVLIGSDPGCHLQVDLPGISPIHARLWTDLNTVTAYDTHAPRGIYVNDQKVMGEAAINSGDWLWLGPPAEAESVCIQCRFEAWVEVLPDAAPAAQGAPPPEAAPPPLEGAGSEAAPPLPLDAYEPAVIRGETAPEPADEPPPVPAPAAAEEPPSVSVEPGLEVLLPAAPEATPPAVPSPPAAPPSFPEEEALLVEAGPAPPDAPPSAPEPEAGGPLAAEPAPEEPPGPAEAPAPIDPAPVEVPAAPPPSAEDPFFVGEAPPATPEKAEASVPETPPAAPEDDEWSIVEPSPPGEPAAPPVAPVEDHFFIAEEVLTEPPPPSPTAGPDLIAGLGTPDLSDPTRVDPAPLRPAEPGAGATPTPEAPLVGEAVSAPSAPPSPEMVPAPVSPSPEPAAPPAAAPPSDGVLIATEAPSPSPAAPVAPEPRPPQAPSEPAPPKPPRPRPSSAARRTPAARARRPARPGGGRRGAPEWVRPVGLGAGAALVLGVIGIALVTWLGGSVQVDEVSPSRVRVGQRAVLTGSGFSDDPTGNTVLFGGVTATVVSASSTRLEVEVPEAVAEAGAERRVPVVVRRGRLESEPLEVSVFQGPVLHGLSPDVALPGEEVVLAGAGWGIGASVRFGDVAAEILAVDTTQIRVTVPPLPGDYGTSAPVVVTVGGVESNPAPFFVGRLPLVTGVQPPAVSVGDVLTVSGRGFERDPGQNDVRVAGVRALVVSGSGEELTVVVPRLGPGDPARSLEVRVPGSQDVGLGVVEVAPAPDPIGLRFVAEPFDGPSAHPHAVLSTGLGPAFVLAAADGRSAAERALAAQQAFNAVVPTLSGSPGLLPEARDVQTRPLLGLPGQLEALVEVTEADAAAYNEDWTRLRGRARAVTPARLARWWEAVARDLVLMLVRAEPPRFAAALASEGRALQQVFDAAQRAEGEVSVAVVAGLRRGTRDGLRLVALRVPPSVTADVPAAAGGTAAVATPAPAPKAEPLRLDGTWAGTENESGRQRYLTVTFRRDYGSIAYEGGLTLTVPFLKLERPGRNRARFTVQIRGGIRHYLGSWDGETLSGNISRDEAGRDVVGTFELRPR